MQNLIHKFVLIGLLCPFIIAVSQHNPVLRNLSPSRARHPHKISANHASLHKRRDKQAAIAASQLQKPAAAPGKKLSIDLFSARVVLSIANNIYTVVNKGHAALTQQLKISSAAIVGRLYGFTGAASRIQRENFSLLDALSAIKFLTQPQHKVP